MKQSLSINKNATGSFINLMMANNSTLPEVGKGATLLGWTDRHAYEVMSVSPDLKRVVIQQYIAERTDNNGMSEMQDYKYEKTNGYDEVIVWKWGAWRKEIKENIFEEEYAKTIGPKWFGTDEHKECFPDDSCNLALVPGKTKQVTRYSKVHILWGQKQEYCDYSF